MAASLFIAPAYGNLSTEQVVHIFWNCAS